jgi:hypothetical protein
MPPSISKYFLVPVLSISTLKTYLTSSYLNDVPPSSSRSSKWTFYQKFWRQILWFRVSSILSICPAHHNLLYSTVITVLSDAWKPRSFCRYAMPRFLAYSSLANPSTREWTQGFAIWQLMRHTRCHFATHYGSDVFVSLPHMSLTQNYSLMTSKTSEKKCKTNLYSICSAFEVSESRFVAS